MNDTDFLNLLEEMILLASCTRPDKDRIKEYCGEPAKQKACCRMLEAKSTWTEQYDEWDFRALGLNGGKWNKSASDHPLSSCPFSNRWKLFGNENWETVEAFRQTALLRCWLSRHSNREKLFDSGVRLLTAGFAFLDQTDAEVVYSTGRHGLIYLPFYQCDKAGKVTFDPLDRFKHDVLARVRQGRGEAPTYAKILNNMEGSEDLRSPFEKRNGIILAPDGEITCFALNYFLRAFAIQINSNAAYSSVEKLGEAISNHWSTPIDLLERVPAAQEDPKHRIESWLEGKGINDDEDAFDRFGHRNDYKYIKDKESLTKAHLNNLPILKCDFRISLREYLVYLGLYQEDETSESPSQRLIHLANWLNCYFGETNTDFLVPEIKKQLVAQVAISKLDLEVPYAFEQQGICKFLTNLAKAFKFSCLNADALDNTEYDPWSKATRTSFLGHTLARCNWTTPSCWYAIPIQAERGSQGTSAFFKAGFMQEVGFMLSLLDASEINKGNGKHFSFDPFAPCWNKESNDCNQQLKAELAKVRAFGHFLGKIEADKVYWMEIVRHQTTREARKSAVAAIAAQSLSHNIGSHALSDANLFDPSKPLDGEGLKMFHQYLQGRMDYVAQLISRIPPQPEPMYLWGDVLGDFFRQRLLLNRLVADRSVEGANLTFRFFYKGHDNTKVIKVTWIDILASLGLKIAANGQNIEKCNVTPLHGPDDDVLVAIPGGAVGRHALYSILENLMRNSVKYGERRKDLNGKERNNLEISMRLRDPGENDDYWLLEIWDNFSGFNKEGDENGYRTLAKNFRKDVINNQSKPQPSGHGLVEIKEAMRFLHDHKDSPKKDETGEPSPWACQPCRRTSPHYKDTSCGDHCKNHCCHANLANIFDPEYDGRKPEKDNQGIGTLIYRVRLRRPRLLGVWCPGAEFEEKNAQSVAAGVFFRKDLCKDGPDGSLSLAKLAPHILLIRDTNSITVDCTKNGSPSIAKICKCLAEHHWYLPYRILIVAENNTRKTAWEEHLKHWIANVPKTSLREEERQNLVFLPYNRVRVITDSACHQALADPAGCDKDLSLVNSTYDTWLRAYKPTQDGKPWHLVLCFERGEEIINDKWKNPLVNEFNNSSLERNPWVVCSVFHKPNTNGPNDYGLLSAGIDYRNEGAIRKEPEPKLTIHFGNHSTKPPGRSLACAWDNGKLHFTQAFGSSDAPRTFHHLYSPPQEQTAFNFYLYRIIEAALTKILIFDERVLSTVFAEIRANENHKLSPKRLANSWAAGLLPAMAIPSGNNKVAMARTDILPSPKKIEHLLFSVPASDEFLDDIKVGTAGLDVNNWANDIDFKSCYSENPTLSADIIALHEGLIEELVSHHCFKEGQELCYLGICPRILRFSGKGPDSRKLDSRHPFAEYSAVSACVIPYLHNSEFHPERLRVEKVFLANAALNSIGNPGKA
ncbi:MAG: ATP-binding protein [Verrucomicrobiota bacterium]